MLKSVISGMGPCLLPLSFIHLRRSSLAKGDRRNGVSLSIFVSTQWKNWNIEAKIHPKFVIDLYCQSYQKIRPNIHCAFLPPPLPFGMHFLHDIYTHTITSNLYLLPKTLVRENDRFSISCLSIVNMSKHNVVFTNQEGGGGCLNHVTFDKWSQQCILGKTPSTSFFYAGILSPHRLHVKLLERWECEDREAPRTHRFSAMNSLFKIMQTLCHAWQWFSSLDWCSRYQCLWQCQCVCVILVPYVGNSRVPLRCMWIK